MKGIKARSETDISTTSEMKGLFQLLQSNPWVRLFKFVQQFANHFDSITGMTASPETQSKQDMKLVRTISV